MCPESTDSDPAALDALFDGLSSTRRRRLLAAVADAESETVARDALVTTFMSRLHGEPASDETAAERERLTVRLHHQHLPKLEAAGLLEYDADQAAVRATDHPAYRDPGIRAAIEGTATADHESLDALFDILASARNRTVLDILSHQYGSVHVDTLARELGAREYDCPESDVDSAVVERVRTSLQHHTLPRLATASLIEFDVEDSAVAYTGHPDLRVAWTHSVLAPDFRASLTGDTDDQEVASIEGREDVVSFGQSLCDRADEELFCLFTETDLLEAGCLTRIQNAADRGVDVYLGTRDPAIRAYVAEHAPGVVLWEPATDWLSLPVEGDRVGRLLLADREAVMLGTLGERTADGYAAEQAIVGDGGESALVVMVRQLLQSRLETLSGDADRFEAELTS